VGLRALACLLAFLAASLWIFVAALVLYSLTSFVMSPMSSYVTEAQAVDRRPGTDDGFRPPSTPGP
jgi:hypothetical protein